jgi:hypothetical protein
MWKGSFSAPSSGRCIASVFLLWLRLDTLAAELGCDHSTQPGLVAVLEVGRVVSARLAIDQLHRQLDHLGINFDFVDTFKKLAVAVEITLLVQGVRDQEMTTRARATFPVWRIAARKMAWTSSAPRPWRLGPVAARDPTRARLQSEKSATPQPR